MSGPGPLTRSKSRNLGEEEYGHDGLETQYLPPPLTIRKSRAPAPTGLGKRRIDVTAIGLALGSPRESPLPPLPSEDLSYFNTFAFSNSTNGRPRAGTDVSMGGVKETKPKASRWKTFGGLFSKKDIENHAEGQSLYSLDHTAQQAWNAVPSQQSPGSRKRAGSDKEKGMDLHNSVANKQVARGPNILRRASTKRKGMRRKKLGEVKVEVPMAQPIPNTTALTQGTLGMIHASRGKDSLAERSGGFSLLQVDIPNVQLERYSVMFDNVLNPGAKLLPQTPLIKPKPTDNKATKPLATPPDAVCSTSFCPKKNFHS